MAHSGKVLVSVFREFSDGVVKAGGGGLCRGGWALGNHSMGFGHFPDIS